MLTAIPVLVTTSVPHWEIKDDVMAEITSEVKNSPTVICAALVSPFSLWGTSGPHVWDSGGPQTVSSQQTKVGRADQGQVDTYQTILCDNGSPGLDDLHRPGCLAAA